MKNVWISVGIAVLASVLIGRSVEHVLTVFGFIFGGATLWALIYGAIVFIISFIVKRHRPENSFLHYFSKALLVLVIIASFGLVFSGLRG